MALRRWLILLLLVLIWAPPALAQISAPAPPSPTAGVAGVTPAPSLGAQMPGAPTRGRIVLPNRCPDGYIEPGNAVRTPHLTTCQVTPGRFTPCTARKGYYACGRAGAECCAPNSDNTCFPGAYACTLGIGTGNQPRTGCCISH